MPHLVVVDGFLPVQRCTEGVTNHNTLEVYGNPTGRLVQVGYKGGAGYLLLDRRMALRLADAIREVAGPPEGLDTDIEGPVRFTYDDAGAATGCEPI